MKNQENPSKRAKTYRVLHVFWTAARRGEELKALPASAEAKKAEGNAAFQAKSFGEAARLYQEAIELAREGGAAVPGVYFSNRAVCLASLGDWAAAAEDAAAALLCPDLPPAARKKALFQKCRAEQRLERKEELEATLKAAERLGLRQEAPGGHRKRWLAGGEAAGRGAAQGTGAGGAGASGAGAGGDGAAGGGLGSEGSGDGEVRRRFEFYGIRYGLYKLNDK